MVDWDIEAQEVRGVVSHTEQIAAGFEDDVKDLQSALKHAGAETSSEVIVAALRGLAEARGTDMQFVYSRIGKAAGAAREAVDAYVQGDHDMVLNVQRRVVRAPTGRVGRPGGPA